MPTASSELQSLIHAYLDGHATEEEAARINALLRTDSAVRDLYLQLADTHSCLAVDEQLHVGRPVHEKTATSKESKAIPRWPGAVFSRSFAVAAMIACCLITVGLGWALLNSSVRPESANDRRQVAVFDHLKDCRWVSPNAQVRVGDAIQSGQRVELSSGSASLLFADGAQLKLIGPAILEALSENSAFLLLGQVAVAAQTPQAKGFALHTRTSKLIDIGTKFIASAAADGQSRVDVSVGSVDVGLKGVEAVQHLRAGDALCVEPGERQIMTRIESGDGTAAFRFPTIEPPSREDYADQSRGRATIRVLRGKLKTGTGRSGPVSVLLDGRGQSHEDSPEESAFFPDKETGSFLLDLGRAVWITKINTYSWHQNTTYKAQRHRAVQKYTLYGSASDNPATDGVLTELGWVRLARVNSDDFFRVADPLDRPAQQACSITAARGSIGRYRYLLWEVQPTGGWMTKITNNTFYGEFDVYADEAP
jgi:hypothetical protein